MAAAPAGADQIGRDHRLAVAGRQRMERAPAEGGEQEEQQDAVARGRALEDRGEAIAAAALARRLRATAHPRCRDRASPRPHAEVRDGAVGRARQQRRRVAAQALGGVVGGDVAAHRGAATGRGDDGLPADAAGERRVAHGDGPVRRDARAEQELDARRPQPPGAHREADAPAGRERQRDAPPADRERHAARDVGALSREDLRGLQSALLEGRDLRLVEDVAHVDAIGGDAHDVEVVDREVAQRVGRRRGRQREHGQGGEEQDALHCSASARRPAPSAALPARAPASQRAASRG
jgi:hypothetical protein